MSWRGLPAATKASACFFNSSVSPAREKLRAEARLLMRFPPAWAESKINARVSGWRATCSLASTPPLLWPMTTGFLNPLSTIYFAASSLSWISLGDGLIGAAHALPAVVSAHRIMAAAVERHEIVTERSEMGRKKAGGTDVKVHLITMAIHHRALARTIRSVVGSIQRVSRRWNADKFSPHI